MSNLCAKQKKILLYLASDSIFYTNLFCSIKAGFVEAGCIVIGGPNLLDCDALIRLIDRENPDFVFEMNRDKSEIPNFPIDVIHLCWVVDFWGRDFKDFSGSDIVYAWSESWIDSFKNNGIDSVKYLPSATNSNIYKPLGIQKKYDFAYLGHIPKPWTDFDLNREVGLQKNEKAYFKDLIPHIEKMYLSNNCFGFFLDNLKTLGFELSSLDDSLMYDITDRIARQIQRVHNINLFLDITNNIAIYGPENWAMYDKYKNNYKGFLEKPEYMNKAIQESNVLLHFTFVPHFRVFDAMACGIVSTATPTPKAYTNEFEILGFKNNEDYVELNVESGKINQEIFNNKQLLADISHSARKKTLENHLWVHRAEQVLKDVERIRYK